MYKNSRSSRDERREVDEIFRAILDTPGENTASVPPNLLFVMQSLLTGGLLITDQALLERIYTSAGRLAQQQSAHLTAEQRNLIAAAMYQLNQQAIVNETPTQPMKAAPTGE